MARSPLVRLPKPLIRGFSWMHRTFVELTGGRLGARFRGQPVILLTTTGRKTGKDRTWPLVGIPVDPEHRERGWVVAASNGGHDEHPGWYLNLQAQPEATVHEGRTTQRVRARDASAEERARYWPQFVELLSTYAQYEAATEREIPVVVLEPIA